MQNKKIKYFIISFVPIFKLEESGYRSQDRRCLFDYLCETGLIGEMEEIGEKFLHCANINPMVKTIAGFLSSEESKTLFRGVELKYIYSSRFASRDILACLENFNARTGDEKFIKIDGGVINSAIEFVGSEAIHGVGELPRPHGYDFIASKYDALHGLGSKNNEKAVVLLGTAPPLFGELFDFLAGRGVKVVYCEYLDIILKSMRKQTFLPEFVLNLNARAKNVNKIIAGLKKIYNKKTIGVIHVFPKFSHYDIEDHFFGRTVAEKYLSLEYAGGGKLGERDRLRLEAFFKIIN